jgi:hypothetical protein
VSRNILVFAGKNKDTVVVFVTVSSILLFVVSLGAVSWWRAVMWEAFERLSVVRSYETMGPQESGVRSSRDKG